MKLEFMMKKVPHKKVTYTFEKYIIDAIEERSVLEKISKSELLSFYIQSAYEMMMEEYTESGGKPIKTIKKRYNTIPKTFTISTEILDVIDFFSEKLDVKKSHLVSASVLAFEREAVRKEQEKLSQEIDELMNLASENNHLE